MSDITRWPIFSQLDPEFVDTIQAAVVFGTGYEAIIVTWDDKVFAFGGNAKNCLGLVNGKFSFEPICIDPLCGQNIVHIEKGPEQMLALSKGGQVFTWNSTLRNGSPDFGFKATLLSECLSNFRVVAIACGYEHSMALTEQGEVFTWGRNVQGQLGLGHTRTQSSPSKVNGLPSGKFICSIACGYQSSFATSVHGEVFAWGYNANGELGVADYTNKLSPSKVHENLDNKRIRQIVCGRNHSLAVTDEGDLYAWGYNSYGQLGDGSMESKLVPIRTATQLGTIKEAAASFLANISAVITTGNKVYMWGYCKGKNVLEPQETRFSQLDDVFACFADPSVSWRPLKFAFVTRNGVKDSIQRSFDDIETSDITFMVEGQPIHAHRAILKIRCQHLRSMLQPIWSEGKKEVIEVTQFSYPVYREFLSYLYCDRIDVTPEVALDLLDLANSYCESDLKLKCAEVIKSGITVENAAFLYAAAVRYEGLDLEEYCFRFCLSHLTAVAMGEAFRQQDAETMKKLMIEAAKHGAFKH